ncbi:MAG: hypothetical protein GX591_19405 [Planctomycetes bacterium]|nr:hypothetical protein [Planctomycetota bacterium]
MAMSTLPAALDIFRTSLPMRAFQHAAADRRTAEAIVVRLHLADGRAGWGEALPRPYVTGETLDSVVDDLRGIFWPLLARCRNEAELREAVLNLPCLDDQRVITAARCAVELAVLGAYGLDWAGIPRRRRPAVPPVTGVLGSRDPRRTARHLRWMRRYGLRHFKLKVGFDDATDEANLRAVHRPLRRALAQGRASLRVDVNGGWKFKEVVERVGALRTYDICAVEQPCPVRAPQLAALAYDCPLPLIADESCLTAADADILFGAEGRVWLNLRLSKNGGIVPTARLARRASAEKVPCVAGCLVGESGILSRAQRALLAAVPSPWAVEGNYGRWLLRDDLVVPSPHFGYGGSLHVTGSERLSPLLRSDRLERYARRLCRLDGVGAGSDG